MKSIKVKEVIRLTGLIIVLGFSACRVQNKQTVTLKGYDTISGYYGTQLQTIQVSVKIKGESTARIKTVPVAFAIPTLLQVMSDPIILYFKDPQNGYGTLYNNADTSKLLNTNVDMDRSSLSFSGEIHQRVDECGITEFELDTGTFQLVAGQKNGFTLKGIMQMNFSMGYRFSGLSVGGCDGPMLNFFEGCYLDDTKCVSGDNAFLHSVFDRFVNSGIINSNEIHLIESLSTSMSYN